MVSVIRTYPLRPYVCFDKKNGMGLDLHNQTTVPGIRSR